MSELDLSRWGSVDVYPTDQGNRRVELKPRTRADLAPMVAAIDAALEAWGRTRSPVFRADSSKPWLIMHRRPIKVPGPEKTTLDD